MYRNPECLLFIMLLHSHTIKAEQYQIILNIPFKQMLPMKFLIQASMLSLNLTEKILESLH